MIFSRGFSVCKDVSSAYETSVVSKEQTGNPLNNETRIPQCIYTAESKYTRTSLRARHSLTHITTLLTVEINEVRTNVFASAAALDGQSARYCYGK